MRPSGEELRRGKEKRQDEEGYPRDKEVQEK